MDNNAPFYFEMPEIDGHEYPSVTDNASLVITRDEWINGGRKAVLDALDIYVQKFLGHPRASGATDGDLPELFHSIDAQLDRIAARINAPDGTMPGALGHRIANV